MVKPGRSSESRQPGGGDPLLPRPHRWRFPHAVSSPRDLLSLLLLLVLTLLPFSTGAAQDTARDTAAAKTLVQIPYGIPVLRTERGLIDVPIYARQDGSFDALLMGLDYDELMLRWVGWSLDGGGAATVISETLVDEADGLVSATIELDRRRFEAGDPEPVLVAWAQFQFLELAFANPDYGTTTDTVIDAVSDLIRFIPVGAPRTRSNGVAPDLALDGSLKIYLANAVGLGSAELSPSVTGFTIPVDVTHLRHDHSLLSMGLDYDELFLSLVGVTPAAGAPDMLPPEVTINEGAPDTISVSFGRTGFPRMLHEHVLDLHFVLDPKAPLPEELAITPLPGEFGGGAEVGAGARDGTRLRSGRLRFVPTPFIRGDVDVSGRVGVSDAILILGSIYRGTDAFDCLEAADVNDSGAVDLSDPVYLLNFLYRSGPLPPAPYPDRGFDPDALYGEEEGLGCHSYGEPYFELLDD